MKRVKKIMAVLLAAIMTMAMAVTAFAADESGATVKAGDKTLTVNVKTGAGVPTQTLKDQTIYLYKLFDVTESTKGETTNYAYTVNTADGYKDAIKSALGNSFTGTTDEEYAKAVLDLGVNNSEGVQNFANAFTTYALTNTAKLTATTNSGKITEEKTSYEFTDLAAGYYLVYVTGGKTIQSSLVTVDDKTTTVDLKTETPSIEKKANKDTVSIGQVVTYTVTGTIPDTTGYDKYTYKILDTLSVGLDFVNDEKGTELADDATTVNVKVAFTDENVTDASTAPTTAALDTENSKKMTLDLSEWVRANQTNNKGKEFTVTYYAKVNANAVVTEQNKASLEYGNDPNNTTKTTPSEAKTPTYPLDIKKVSHADQALLAGAKFSLYPTEEDATNGTNAIKVSETVKGTAGSYVVDPTSSDTVFESVDSKIGENDYNLHVNGLAAGTYYLKEVEAPDGYNKLTDAVEIKITKSADADVTNWTISKNSENEEDKIIDIENSTGSLLPSTGGKGAIAFGIVAAILVLGVVVSFMRDKRKAAQ